MRLFWWSGAAAVRTMVPDMAGKVLIVANPTSGGYSAEFLDDVRNRLEDLGCKTEIRLTRRAGEIGDICADPSLPVQTLVVAGGDGSVVALFATAAQAADGAAALAPLGATAWTFTLDPA